MIDSVIKKFRELCEDIAEVLDSGENEYQRELTRS